jgi:hypothetical protein
MGIERKELYMKIAYGAHGPAKGKRQKARTTFCITDMKNPVFQTPHRVCIRTLSGRIGINQAGPPVEDKEDERFFKDGNDSIAK